MKRFLPLLLVFVLLATVFTGCGGGGAAEEETEPLKVGAIYPLSGANALLGNQCLTMSLPKAVKACLFKSISLDLLPINNLSITFSILSNCTMPVVLTTAPRITMLATLSLCKPAAISLASMKYTSISSLPGFSFIRERLTNKLPPGATISSNLTKEGKFMATTEVASDTMGEFIFLSDTITVQLAVPPLISGP